jgi:hypothetical protein
MVRRYGTVAVIAAVLMLAAGSTTPARGQEVDQRLRELRERIEVLEVRLARQDTTGVAELRRQIDVLTRELEAMRLGEAVVARADTTELGFGPAASKVYRAADGVSIGGYGEVLFEKYAAEREDGSPAGTPDQMDALRAVVYVGYKFNDRLLFNSEIEVEHGSTEQAGAVSLEFAYLDLRVAEALGIRGGLLLMPMGFINELHEPPTFLGATRPETERFILPSTWRETGLGVFGAAAGLEYRAYVVTGLDAVGGAASQAEGFSAAEGIRGGRQNGSKALAEDFAGVVRVDYEGLPGLRAGGSVYYGQSGQNRLTLAGEELRVPTLIYEGHIGYRAYGFDVRALMALAAVSQAAELNGVLAVTGAASVAEQMLGWYAQLGYDVLQGAGLVDQLVPYVRYEVLDTQRQVPASFNFDPANARSILTVGLAWRPTGNAILKADYALHSNDASTGLDRLSVALGYLF